jgi:hypothetical protein
MTAILVDSNVILDVLTVDPQWYDWSAQQLEDLANQALSDLRCKLKLED